MRVYLHPIFLKNLLVIIEYLNILLESLTLLLKGLTPTSGNRCRFY